MHNPAPEPGASSSSTKSSRRAASLTIRGIAMQPPISLDTVRPLLVNTRQQQATMYFTFACPVSGERVEANAHMDAHRSVGDRVKESAQSSFMWHARSSFARAVGRAFGYNFLGHMAQDMAYQAMSSTQDRSSVNYSQEARDAALLEAFRYVSDSFRWDEEQQRYISAKIAGQRYIAPFDQQLQDGPILLPYDQHITSRILVHISALDGQLSREEHQFLSQMLPPNVPSIEQLREAGAPNQAEIEHISEGPLRETILMLAWTIAAIDRRIQGPEASFVIQISSWFGIDPERATEVRSWAFQYVLDQMLPTVYWGGQRNPAAYQEYLTTAQHLKISQLDAERTDAAWRKRHNVF
jgi:hypothetical protein